MGATLLDPIEAQERRPDELDETYKIPTPPLGLYDRELASRDVGEVIELFNPAELAFFRRYIMTVVVAMVNQAIFFSPR